jgi:hypothetical protein
VVKRAGGLMTVLSIVHEDHDRSLWGTTSLRKTLSSTLILLRRRPRCHVIAGHDRHDRYSGQRPAAESHLVRRTEACIGCRCVDSHDNHGSVKRSTLNHRLGCRALALGLQSLEACSQIAKQCWRKREAPQQDRLQDLHGPRGNRPSEAR